MQLTIDADSFAQHAGSGLLARLGRRKTWCMLGFIVTAAAVAAAFTAVPQTYRASAALMVASDDTVLRSGAEGAEAQRAGDPADIESQMLMLRSPRLGRIILNNPAVAEALVADCEAAREGTWATRLVGRLQEAPSCKNVATDHTAALQRLEGAFSIGPSGRSRVIEVSFVSAVPETAVIVANALVDAYLADDKARKVDTHDNAINWLKSEIERSAEELRTAETDVETYRSQHGIVRGQLASISSERLSALGQQLAAAQAAYAQAMSRSNEAGGGASAQEVLSSPTISDLKRLATELAAHKADLQQRYGERYPAVLGVSDQLRTVQRQLDTETRRITTSLQKDQQAAAARVAELKAQFDKMMVDVGDTGGAEAGIAIMVRDVEARREIYVEQLKKVNALQTERRLLTGDARLVNHAELPERPWFPKRLPFAAVGIVLASAVGAGLGLVRDHGDRTLRTTSNLRQLGGIAIAGYVPWVRPRRGARWPFRHLYNPSPLQETIRAIFSRYLLVPGIAPKTVMIGSSDVGEGKTFLTLALALFAVTTGRRVLVIEADLRRPTFRKALGLEEGPGLREFLEADAEPSGPEVALDDIVTHYRGLHVIAAGKPSVASTELLSKTRFERLLKAANAAYDLVILDSPPALLLMDSQVLARRVDGIIFCASFGRSRMDRVLRGINELENAGGHVLGVVVGGGGADKLLQDGPSGSPHTYYLPSPT